MSSTIAADLEKIKKTLELCLEQGNAEGEIVEFYSELAASKQIPVSELQEDINKLTDKILNAINQISSTTHKGWIPTDVEEYAEGFTQLTEAINLYWDLLTPKLKEKFINLGSSIYDFSETIKDGLTWRAKSIILSESIKKRKNLFQVYITAHDSLIDAIAKKSGLGEKLIKINIDEGLRAIAYSMDLLIPGFYLWFPRVRIRIGGAKPDDDPYKYPGVIHSSIGISLVLPRYVIFTTYQGNYDPQQASDIWTTKI